MTWQAKFKVTDVTDGDGPQIAIIASASIVDGNLIQNTEKASVMELRIMIDSNETNIKVGDEITGSGHFVS